jgi:Condensation domain
MTERIFVSFEGEGSGTDELSWGQRVIWNAMRMQGSSLSMGGARPLAEGRTVSDVAAAARFVLARHQSLRTRLRFEPDGRPTQVVASSGEIPLEIVEAGDAQPAGVAEALAARYKETNFDYTGEWPIRLGVVTRRGVPTHVAEVVCHLATDGYGMTLLKADLAGLGGGTGPAGAPVTAMQPLEQARSQRTPAAQRHCDAAMRYWERLLRAVPDDRFCFGPDDGQPRCLRAVYDSPAVRLAIQAIAARTKVSTSQVLLAAFAVTLARLTGRNPVVALVLVNNRFRPGFADTVSPVSAPSLCVIDVADITFDEAVLRAWHSAMAGYKHAYYEPDTMWDLIGQVGMERGGDIDLAYFFNDLRVRHRDEPTGPASPAPDLRAALRRSTLAWGRENVGHCDRVFLYINDVPGTVSYEAWVDNRYVSSEDLEAALRGLEELTVEAALDPAAPTGIRSVVV